MILDFLWAFVVGGAICAVAQLCMDLTPFSVSASHILVSLVTVGEILGFFGIYPQLIRFAGMGAAVPLCGFGNTIVEGVMAEVEADGLMGILTGGFTAAAAGLCAAMVFGFVTALLARPKG